MTTPADLIIQFKQAFESSYPGDVMKKLEGEELGAYMVLSAIYGETIRHWFDLERIRRFEQRPQ